MTISPEVQAQIDGLTQAINEIAAKHRRVMAENERLRAALERSICPLPLSDADDDTVAACIRTGACGCGARAALADTAEPDVRRR